MVSIDIIDSIANGRGKNHGTSTIFGAGFNFVNSIVGAGIIGIPVAIKECGLVMGIVILIFVAIMMNRSTVLIVECGIKAKVKNLEELCRYLFGPSGYKLATLFMFLYAYGAMIAYMVIIGDTVPSSLNYMIGDKHTPDKDTVVLIMATVFILPLSLLRDMSSLSVTSLLSITADILMIAFICYKAKSAAIDQDTEFDPATDYTIVDSDIFAGIGTISFAFVCQDSSFIVFRSMLKQDLESWTTVSNISMFIASGLCFLLGIFGYMSFGSNVDGDILNNFSDNDGLIVGARLLLAITMIFTYPMECFVTRHALISLAVDLLSGGKVVQDDLDEAYRVNVNTVSYDMWVSRSRSRDEYSSVSDSVIAASTLFNDNNDDADVVHGVLNESIWDLSRNDSVGSLEARSVRIGSGHRYSGEVWVEEDQELPVHPVIHIGVTLLLWTSSVTIAVIFGDLSVVLALTGSLAGSMLGYIIPAAIYFKTYEQEWSTAWNVLYNGDSSSVAIINSSIGSSGHIYDTTATTTTTNDTTTGLLRENHHKLSISDRVHCFFSDCEGGKFILPGLMMIFGVIAMVIGVGTVIIGLCV